MYSMNSIIKKHYSNGNLSEKDYSKGRNVFLIEGGSGTGIFSLTTGAFLAGFANYLGVSNSLSGIICAIPSLVCVIQIFSSILFEQLSHRKFIVSAISFLAKLILGIMFFIPILALGKTGNAILLAIIYGVAYGLTGFIAPPLSNWIVDLTPNNIRGRYLAKKDGVSLIASTIITIILGKMLDLFKSDGRQTLGFIFIGITVIILAIINFLALSSIKEPKVKISTTKLDLKTAIIEPFKNKAFKKVLVLSAIWNIAFQIGAPFFAIYMVTELKLDYAYIMIWSMIGAVVRVLATQLWGKMADSKSWTIVTKLALAVLALNHITWLFLSADLKSVLFPVVNIIGSIAWGGLPIAMFNIQFVFAPKEGRTMYLGMNAAFGGIIGFLTAILGSTIVSAIKANTISIFGISIGAMQMLFGMSGILILFCAVYVHYVMEHEEVIS
jgi:MFS family permease